MLNKSNLRRYMVLDARRAELRSELAAVESEYFEIKDEIETELECRTHRRTHSIGGFEVQVKRGERVVDWEREYRQTASQKAIARLMQVAPRATALIVTEATCNTN
ncbi:hypothetical protein [Rosistilla oblonga]|uniref:hypothetical protein n=1 Tax=Rosistilla oblonga TaxID=2527990 RepID=UPI003A9852A3